MARFRRGPRLRQQTDWETDDEFFFPPFQETATGARVDTFSDQLSLQVVSPEDVDRHDGRVTVKRILGQFVPIRATLPDESLAITASPVEIRCAFLKLPAFSPTAPNLFAGGFDTEYRVLRAWSWWMPAVLSEDVTAIFGMPYDVPFIQALGADPLVVPAKLKDGSFNITNPVVIKDGESLFFIVQATGTDSFPNATEDNVIVTFFGRLRVLLGSGLRKR